MKTKLGLLVFLFLSFSIIGMSQGQESKAKPLIYFPFDEIENEAVEDSLNSYLGVLMDGLAGSSQKIDDGTDQEFGGPQLDAGGKHGSALSFDGEDDYVNVFSGLELKNSQAVSTAFWFKVEKLPQLKHTIIQLLGDDIAGENIFAEAYLDSRGLVLSWQSPEGNKEIVDSSLPVGDWVHVGSVFGDGEVSLYVNGEKKEPKQSSLTDPTAKYMIIAANTKGDFFKGSIDELIVYDGIASEQQIKDAFNGVKPELPEKEVEVIESEESREFPEMTELPASTGQLVLYLPLDKSQINAGADVGNALLIAPTVSIEDNSVFVKVGGTEESEDHVKSKISEAKIGEGLSLDGLDDRIEVPHSDALSFSGSNSFTLSAWIKPESGDQEFQAIIRQRPDIYGSPWPYSLNLDKENKHVQFSLATGSLDVDRFVVLTSKAEIPAGEWTHIAASLTTGKMRIYINGELDSEQDFEGKIQPSSSRALSIGSAEPYELGFNGVLDEIRFYNYGLTLEEVKNLLSPEVPVESPEKEMTESEPESEPAETLYDSPDISVETSTCLEENPELCYTQENCESIGLNWCPYEYEGGVCQIDAC